jgi:hypothetical protein
VFQRTFEHHKADIKERLNNVMRTVAYEMVSWLQGGQTPRYTGNMQDATGLGVYIDGTLSAYAPMQTAWNAQTYKGREVWGYAELQDSLQEGYTNFDKGVWLVLFSAVPYAFEVDAYGTIRNAQGYFSDGITSELLQKFKTAFAQEFPIIAKQLSI